MIIQIIITIITIIIMMIMMIIRHFFFINTFQVTQEQITEPVTTVNTLKKTMIIQF